MNWLEVSLTVNGELAEAVADVLARFAPNGVVTEQGVDFVNDEDEGTPTGPVAVRAYLPADEHLEETRQKLEESLFYLGMIQPLPAPVYTPVADQNWMEAWKSRYRPIPVGKRLMIVPAWLESPEPARIPIRIEPGMAFGTGTHPSTQLCLELIEAVADRAPLSTAIDVGCGSGILSIAAIRLGATAALGVDIDREAIKSAGENAALNGVADRLTLGLGSVEEVRAGAYPLRSAPLVLANILAPVLVRLFEAGLADLIETGGRTGGGAGGVMPPASRTPGTKPGGAIILAGILEPQAEGVIQAGRAHGLELVQQSQIADWVALLMGK